MDKIGLHIPYLLIGIVSWISIVVLFIYSYAYFSWLWNKIDRIYSILDTERVNVEIDTNCN